MLASLIYHRVQKIRPTVDESFHQIVSTQTFRDHMAKLGDCCDIVTLSDIESHRRSLTRSKQLYVHVTVDDGYAETAIHVTQIASEFGIRPTYFIPAAHIGSVWPYWWDWVINGELLDSPTRASLAKLSYAEACRRAADMGANPTRLSATRVVDWTEVRDISRNGYVASHGLFHEGFSTTTVRELIRNLEASRRAFLTAGVECGDAVAAPNGDCGAIDLAAAPQLPFRLLFGAGKNVVSGTGHPDSAHLPRIYVSDRPATHLLDKLIAVANHYREGDTK